MYNVQKLKIPQENRIGSTENEAYKPSQSYFNRRRKTRSEDVCRELWIHW